VHGGVRTHPVGLTDLRPRTRRRIAADLITELEAIDKKIKNRGQRPQSAGDRARLDADGLGGIGPSGAARLLAGVGDTHRFADRDKFASWNGTAPPDASSGDQQRHRLSRAGNRRINRIVHTIAVVQLRHRTTAGRAYYNRRTAGGMPSMMAMRALKRRLSNLIYARMVADQTRREAAGPGGHSETTRSSSAAGPHPHTGSSDKPHPGPATSKPTTTLPTAPWGLLR
jgi:transposase